MRTVFNSGQFRRDVKLAQKRGKDTSKLRDVPPRFAMRSPFHRGSAITNSPAIGSVAASATSNLIGSSCTGSMGTTCTLSEPALTRICSKLSPPLYVTPITAETLDRLAGGHDLTLFLRRG